MNNNNNSDGPVTPTRPKAQRKITTPKRLESLYEDSDSADDDFINQIRSERDNTMLDKPFRSKKRSKNGVRDGKNMDVVGKNIKNSYEFTNKTRDSNLPKYKNDLFDMLVNGNYRIKFSPKCATRTGAAEYCKSKFDNEGYPLYRLLPPNGAKDLFGNSICDLNGDQVDDIIIVNTKGEPSIINGYKLVRASPYKKHWQELRAQDPKIASFNLWLQEQFDATRTWNYDENQWKAGKFELKVPEKMEEAYNGYVRKGLGKPRVSTRITARGLWSSIFSKLWKWIVGDIIDDHPSCNGIQPVINYMKVCNAVFIILYEIPAMKSHGIDSWVRWLGYKSQNSKEVNAEIGSKLQNDYNTDMKNYVTIEDGIKNEVDIDENTVIFIIYHTAHDIIVDHGLKLDNNTYDAWSKVAAAIKNKTISKAALQKYCDVFKDNIDVFLNTQVDDYLKYKNSSKAETDGFKSGADNYIHFPKKRPLLPIPQINKPQIEEEEDDDM